MGRTRRRVDVSVVRLSTLLARRRTFAVLDLYVVCQTQRAAYLDDEFRQELWTQSQITVQVKRRSL